MRKTFALALTLSLASVAGAADLVKTDGGALQGVLNPATKVTAFKGIPFAAPPVGDLRWQPPKKASAWEGVKQVNAFGPRCMQGAIFSDMIFRDPGPSEDCLYLNVWTPAGKADAALPVMVWIYGGGFQAGAASEPRQDGEKLAQKGVVVVSMNYRLGVFGFFSHPELTKESEHHASGNYGLMDQAAALAWVKKNIAGFGGDPGNVTIFGESAGSMSVSGQVASPISKNLFQKAIGESGGAFTLTGSLVPLAKSEVSGSEFAQSLKAASLKELRAMPAPDLLKAALADKSFRFWWNIDGYFFPENPASIYAAGRQAHVPLLAGWNADEQSAKGFFGKSDMTEAGYTAKLHELYGEHADEVLKEYPAGDKMETSARDLASDRFIAYATWKWLEAQLATGGSAVYRYHFEQAPPVAAGEQTRGAYHSADIKYVFETLDSGLAWTEGDRKESDLISSYWTNFAKTGDPNGTGLPKWPAYKPSDYQVMHLGGEAKNAEGSAMAAPDTQRGRYLLLDKLAAESKNEEGK